MSDGNRHGRIIHDESEHIHNDSNSNHQPNAHEDADKEMNAMESNWTEGDDHRTTVRLAKDQDHNHSCNNNYSSDIALSPTQ
jgi:hypothetical protein